MSEPKTPAEHAFELCEALDEGAEIDAIVHARDEQIRQQERARVAELEVERDIDREHFSLITRSLKEDIAELERSLRAANVLRQAATSQWADMCRTHISRAQVREVLLDRLRWNRPRGFDAAPADTPAMVEARRLIAEGWEPNPFGPKEPYDKWISHTSASDREPATVKVGKAVVDAMRALMGGGK